MKANWQGKPAATFGKDGKVSLLQWITKYLRVTLVSCEIAHNGKNLISIFQEFSSSIKKTFILGGGLGAGLLFYGV